MIRLRFDEKRAAIEWSMGKLLTAIFLAFFLALVVYGYSQGMHKPLIEKVEGAMNSVLVMFGMRDGGGNVGECFSQPLIEVSGGKELLKEIGTEESKWEDYTWSVCNKGACYINTTLLEGYLSDYSGFYFLSGSEKRSAIDRVLLRSSDSSKFHWEVYNSARTLIEKLDIDWEKRFTRVFILNGVAEGSNENSAAIWENGYWRVFLKPKAGGIKLLKITDDDEVAINTFVKIVWEKGSWFSDDDEVYYDFASPNLPNKGPSISAVKDSPGRPVSDLVGGNNEIDSDVDVRNLKKEFARIKSELLKEVQFSKEEIEGMKSKLEGDKALIGESELPINIISEENSLVFSFDIEGERHGIRVSTLSELSAIIMEELWKNNGELRSVPDSGYFSKLVQLKDSKWVEIGNERDYKMDKKDFDKFYKNTKIKEFMENRCR